MLEDFRGFIDYTDDEYKEIWEEALIVVDTNILINFYKYSSEESNKILFGVLKKLKDFDRLWIPHQVALEYFFNYESDMNKQYEGYDLLGKKLLKLKEQAENTLKNIKSDYPYIDIENFHFFVDDIQKSNKKLDEKLNKVKQSLPNPESIRDSILDLLSNIVGESYSQNRIDEIENYGKDRYSNGVPPGFEDKDKHDKQNYRTYGNIRYQRLYGDLIVWNQMIDKAREVSKPIIFITEDKKGDWWDKEGKNIKRPQPHLIQEFSEKTEGQKFYMYRTDNFVKYANFNLSFNFTEQQLNSVTEDIENIRELENNKDTKMNFIYSESDFLIDKYNEDLKNVKVDELMGYLSNEDKGDFSIRLKEIADTANGTSEFLERYDWLIMQAILTAIPGMEEEAKNLIAEIATKDYDKAKLYTKKFNSLQKEKKVKKGILLLELNNRINSDLISFNLPF